RPHRRGGPDAGAAVQARRRGLPVRRRTGAAGRTARDSRRRGARGGPAHARGRHAARDGPQPRVRRARRRRHPRALDAQQVQPAGGAVRAHDRRRRRRHGGRRMSTATPTPDARQAPVLRSNLVALGTITRREVMRILRIWSQTLVPPAITMTLYFLIFGGLIGSRIGTMDGIGYMDFIVPGLVMMSVIRSEERRGGK